MTREIEKDFKGREIVIVSLLNGTVMFLADLIRSLSLPLHLDFINISNYNTKTKSNKLVFTKELHLDIHNHLLASTDRNDTPKTVSNRLF